MKPIINKFSILSSILIILLVWLTWPWITGFWTSSVDNLPPNEFGDSFGSISALFTGLAFFGLVISLAIQRDDFDQSIEQMKRQNEMMADNMSLNLFPTLFKQKLEDLRGLLSSKRHSENIENLRLETVSKIKIAKWLSTERKFMAEVIYSLQEAAQEEYMENEFGEKERNLQARIDLLEEFIKVNYENYNDDAYEPTAGEFKKEELLSKIEEDKVKVEKYKSEWLKVSARRDNLDWNEIITIKKAVLTEKPIKDSWYLGCERNILKLLELETLFFSWEKKQSEVLANLTK